MRTIKKFPISPKTFTELKNQLGLWGQAFDEVCFLDSNRQRDELSSFSAVLAADAFTSLKTDYFGGFENLREYQNQCEDWLFGILSYDLKNDTEVLTSENFDRHQFPALYFFQPKRLIFLKEDCIEFHYLKMIDDELQKDYEEILETPSEAEESPSGPVQLLPGLTKKQYLKRIDQLQEHIQRGDVYEANFCMEFTANQVQMDAFAVFQKLNSLSQAPFAGFFKEASTHLLCASPERFLKKKGNSIYSQPIKGTAKRDPDPVLDKKIARQLRESEKERAENIMIVDLVRNDLSRTAAKNSVKVDELCGLYSFEQVHQLISTVSCQLKQGVMPVDVLETTFPMGSMTGAPKISAMKIIEKLESFKRGLYSGSLGYFSPEGDFDFNVIIRSILYNKNKQTLSAPVGGAITAKSNPVQEYEECLLKAKAMRQVLDLGGL